MICFSAPKGLRQWAEVYWLYRRAFPGPERKPFSVILNMYRQGKTDVWYFQREGQFTGLAATINGDADILLDYLAVVEKQRGNGIGTEMLHQLCRHYEGKGIFLEIESAFEDCENREERLRRRRFYENAGMKSMDVFADVFGVNMELMGFGCRLTFEEYRAFYRDYYGAWAAEHIRVPKK